MMVPTIFLLALCIVQALQMQPAPVDRRGLLKHVGLTVASSVAFPVASLAVGTSGSSPDLKFVSSPTGLQYADAKIGTGESFTQGTVVTIDYVMSTTGARYGSKIYSTADKGAPYRFKLGDKTTIKGIEEAIAGGDGVEPMKAGGVRRIIIPATLAYQSLAQPVAGMQYQDCQEGKGVGPIPPVEEGTAGEYYQRFKNIYCNANRPYQPDLVMDVKLYGKR